MLNPMKQAEPSKVAIFSNAEFSWNVWHSEEKAEQTWYDSFKYVDHMGADETAASEALRELSKHMIHQNGNRGTDLPESVELAPALLDFQHKMEAGTLNGMGNDTLAPTATATRAQVAVMLQRFIDLIK